MALAEASPRVIWAVSDGRPGIENQALGLAEAVARLIPARIETRRLSFRPTFDRWPTLLRLRPQVMLAADSDRLEPPWPDIWIAAGRASLPFSIRARRWSGGRTLVVQLQNPRWPLEGFDLVIPPRHDDLHGFNVFPILGSANRITPDRLKEAPLDVADRLAALRSPRVAVLIGGRSKVHDLTDARAEAMADQIAAAVTEAGGSILLTVSRRTPETAAAILTERLSTLAGWIWDGEAPNPYFAFLGAADHILVTEDSTNMITEAAATGRPVHILSLDGGSAKFDRLHAELRAQGITRPFDGRLEAWSYPPLDETARAAEAVVEALERKAPSR